MGKPSGLKTARKLRLHRRDQRWHDLGYKKAHLGTRWKANPFGGSSHAKGLSSDLIVTFSFIWLFAPLILVIIDGLTKLAIADR